MRIAKLSWVIPALFTKIFKAPRSLTMLSINASQAAASFTFKTAPAPPVGFNAASMSLAPDSLVAVPITTAPCFANSIAIARPIPRDAPVTKAICPVNVLTISPKLSSLLNQINALIINF